MWLGIGAAIAVAVALFVAFGDDSTGLPECTSPPQTPCMVDGLVLVPDRSGHLERITLARWKAERADAQYDLVPPFAGFGPVGP